MSNTLSMYRGDYKVVQVTVNNLNANGLTNCKFWFTAKMQLADADAQAVIQRLPADFTPVQNGDATTPGIVTCEINPADTNSLPDYMVFLDWDVQMANANDKPFTIKKGKLKVQPDVTRATP